MKPNIKLCFSKPEIVYICEQENKAPGFGTVPRIAYMNFLFNNRMPGIMDMFKDRKNVEERF